jgi:hypothetical protein
MKAEIIAKKSGSRRHTEDTQRIVLDRPSVIVLKLAPENVARYERHGDDLVLLLKDGREITIPGFFAKYPEGDSAEQASADAAHATADGTPAEGGHGRNELVLEDDSGVTWWGQYPDQWSEFHFTEIEWNDGGFVWSPWPLGALGGITAGTLAVSSGGHDGGNHDNQARPPVADDDSASGGKDGGPVTGNVLANDRDPGGDALTVTGFTIDGTTYSAGDTASIAGVGTFTIGKDGGYSFTPEANWSGTVPTVTYTISNGKGGTDTADLVITITPATDLTAADDSATTDEDTPVSGTVATNDQTASGGDLTFARPAIRAMAPSSSTRTAATPIRPTPITTVPTASPIQ